MTRPPLPAHRSRSHAELLDVMARDGRRRARGLPQPWDPVRREPTELADHGRGLLDALALGLHVLWTYQQAWADEGFLATARLPASVRRLLDGVGYAGDPGFAASGLQHFRCREGIEATLPPGFRVRANAAGPLPAAVYETTRALRITPVLNEIRPFLPAGPLAPDTAGAISSTVALLEPEVVVPPPAVAGAVAFSDTLGDRFAVGRTGNLVQRNAIRAKQKALALADLVADLRAGGAEQLCPDVFEQLCQDLCDTQELANEAGFDPAPGPLSESQELLVTLLRGMSTRQPETVQALAEALARAAGESDADWSRRLDKAAAFLDALVAGLLQEARDQVVRLRGPRALEALDRELGGPPPLGADAAPRPGARGVAAPGTDSLYVPVEVGDRLRPGDWLVVAEDPAPAEAGGPPPPRLYREAVRVVRLRTETPSGAADPAVRVTFAPPLGRRYDLAGTTLLGNVTEVTHGGTVADTAPWTGDGAHLALAAGPLTWIRSAEPDAVEGRVPAVSLAVSGRGWTRVDDLRGQSGGATTFAVEVTPDATSRLRLAEAGDAAAVIEGTPVTVTYRTGIGAEGNRPALAASSLATAEPAVAETFNPLPLSGGVDPEDAERSRARAGTGTHVLRRAVSVADLRGLALSFGGVGQAAVLRDPVRRRDHVTVVVAATGGGVLDPADAVRLRAFLLSRTPPGTTVTIADRGVVPVRMRLVLRVEPGRDPLAVVRLARIRLGADDPEPGGTEPPGLLHPDAAALGRSLHLSDVHRALGGIPHLGSVLVDLLHRDGTPPSRRDVVAAGPAELVAWAPAGPGPGPLDLVWEEARDR